MARLSLNKSSLHKEREQLRLYRGVLPSLELKRQQLTLEFNRAKRQLEDSRRKSKQVELDTVAEIPMLANQEIDLSGLVRVSKIFLKEENLVGIKLPRLDSISFDVLDYSMLGKPPWVDLLVVKLQKIVEAQTQVTIAEERVKRLESAVRRITQRVNLFEKMLIPEAQENIRKIKIFLGDAERAAVVRSKMAKARLLEFSNEMASAGAIR